MTQTLEKTTSDVEATTLSMLISSTLAITELTTSDAIRATSSNREQTTIMSRTSSTAATSQVLKTTASTLPTTIPTKIATTSDVTEKTSKISIYTLTTTQGSSSGMVTKRINQQDK